LATDYYTFDDLKNFDNIEKQKLSLYNSTELTNGFYKDFNSFKNQNPEKEITNVAFSTPEKITKIYELIDGKEKEIKKDEVYSVVYQGISYIISLLKTYSLRQQKEIMIFILQEK
jgi:hypothetical protein